MEDLPYKCEYAKSGRASCKGCKSPIAKDVLRLAVMVQSPMFDGKVPHWYHDKCFFQKQRPKAPGDFANFLNLRYEDQQKLQKEIESNVSVIVESTTKGKKRGKPTGALKDFKIEYAKSGRALCRGCELKILKDDIRIAKKSFDTDIGKQYGGQDLWHHLDCFVKLRSELLFYGGGDILPGFLGLSKDDQKMIKQKIPPIKSEDGPTEAKQVKTEDNKNGKESTEEKAYKKQYTKLYKNRDALKKALLKKDLQNILEENNQNVPAGEDRLLDRVADIFTFGALGKCNACNEEGKFVFRNNIYMCDGNLTEWTKCSNRTETPERKPFIIPDELSDVPLFKNYKYKPENRIIKHLVQTVGVVKSEKLAKDEPDGPKIKVDKPVLYEMEFYIHSVEGDKELISKRIRKLGGKTSHSIHDKTMAVISKVTEVEKMGSRISKARDHNVHVVSENFLDDLESNQLKTPFNTIKQFSICTWGSEPEMRVREEKKHSHSESSSSKSKSRYAKSKSGPVKMALKGGGAVDPDSELQDVAHVYQKGKDKYTVILGLTDIQQNKNSFYKLQVLEADKGNKYWLFRSWGRIGTTIGGNKVEKMDSLHEALHSFKALYEEKSANSWENRDNFVKVPGKLYPIDVDYGEDAESKGLTTDDITSNSKLDKPIQNLVQMLFDVSTMKKTMLEFELDTEKMPLGKLSKKQIQAAFSVLSELQGLIDKPEEKAKLIDACNRFYTLIPHDFGVDSPPLILTSEEIKKKSDMLDNLIELEIAYNLMKDTTVDSKGHHCIDSYYEKLNTEISVLDKETDEFKIIEKYVKNTHADTHTQYELVIEDVFKIKRKGEEKRFKPFKKISNRKLLWHGSRVSNFAGILAQGLRIAPPEAPVTGYMFGKGIYFADMVSKSANYCCTDSKNNTGLLLLCEVALGDMYERTSSEYIEKLPKGKHSCKGVGRTEPNPKEIEKLDGDVEVPVGKGVKKTKLKSDLLYNEYIVYDVAQVNCKYLLKMNFKYTF